MKPVQLMLHPEADRSVYAVAAAAWRAPSGLRMVLFSFCNVERNALHRSKTSPYGKTEFRNVMPFA